jgi:hypothetical protein
MAVLGLLKGPRLTHDDGEGPAVGDLRKRMARSGKRDGMRPGLGHGCVLKKAEGTTTINVGTGAADHLWPHICSSVCAEDEVVVATVRRA